MPSLQNPTTATTPLASREAVAALARRLDFQVIEDDVYGFLLPEGAPPPLATIAPGRTWYVRSLSKSLAPGLRTAYLLAPPGQEERTARLIRATVWSAPSFGPAIASHWIADGTAAKLVSERRQEAQARQEIALAILPPEIGRPTQSAMHLWMELPGRFQAQTLTEAAATAGTQIAPGSAFGVGCSPNAVRFSLCAPPSRADLTCGLTGLTALLSSVINGASYKADQSA
jgi:DNA-binding transcriptional MocR family regulator